MKARKMTAADYLEIGIQPPRGFFSPATGRAFAFGNKLHEKKKAGWTPAPIITN